MGLFCDGLNNEGEISVVYEPSVFEPLDVGILIK